MSLKNNQAPRIDQTRHVRSRLNMTLESLTKPSAKNMVGNYLAGNRPGGNYKLLKYKISSLGLHHGIPGTNAPYSRSFLREKKAPFLTTIAEGTFLTKESVIVSQVFQFLCRFKLRHSGISSPWKGVLNPERYGSS